MKRLGVMGNPRYHDLRRVLTELRRIAPENGFTLLVEDDLYPFMREAEVITAVDSLDFVVTLGGDGTMLRAARLMAGHNVPILGINLGRLGFLTCCGEDEMERALQRMARGEFESESRMTLAVHALDQVGRKRETWTAVNDVVLHKGGFARVVRVRVNVDEEPVATFAADGVVVSTPTGSTAYSLSAGGPIVYPVLESIVLTPISAHSLSLRPLVFPPSMSVLMEADDGSEELLVTVDGQVGTTLSEGEKLVVERSHKAVIFARFHDRTFFNTLRSKLGWGGPAAPHARD